MMMRKATAWLVGGLACLSVVTLGSPRAARGRGFDDFISPVSNPVNFEDPRSTTEIRSIYVYLSIANTFPVQGTINGGDAHVAGAQAWLAVTDRLSIIATKGGYIWLRPEDDFKVAGQEVWAKKNGFANVAFGAKFAVYVDPDRRAMATLALGARYRLVDGTALAGKTGGVDVGATYELPISHSGDLFGWRVTSDLVLYLR